MKTRITQEEAYEFLKSLPKEIDREVYKNYQKKSLHLKITSKGMKFTFTEERLEDTFNLENFRLSYFYKGKEMYKRVPLQVGSMALWTTVFQYMEQVSKEEKLPVKIDKSLRYIGTDDEAVGVSGVSSSQEMPYRLTHTFFTERNEELLFIEDVYKERNTRKESVYYRGKFYELDYLQADRLRRMANWGQSRESELSKLLEEELREYKEIKDLEVEL